MSTWLPPLHVLKRWIVSWRQIAQHRRVWNGYALHVAACRIHWKLHTNSPSDPAGRWWKSRAFPFIFMPFSCLLICRKKNTFWARHVCPFFCLSACPFWTKFGGIVLQDPRTAVRFCTKVPLFLWIACRTGSTAPRLQVRLLLSPFYFLTTTLFFSGAAIETQCNPKRFFS